MIFLVDIILLLILAYLVFRGYRRGALSEILAAVSIFIAFIVAVNVYKEAGKLLESLIETELYRNILTITLLFFASVIGLHFLGRLATRALNLTILGSFNKLVGAVIGMAKGLLIVFIAAAAIILFVPDSQEVMANSIIFPRVMLLTNSLVQLTPATVREKLQIFENKAYFSLIGKLYSAPCHHCGHLSSASALYCGTCGSRLGYSFVCPGCLLPMTDSIEVCPGCSILPISTKSDRFSEIIAEYESVLAAAGDSAANEGVLIEFKPHLCRGLVMTENKDTIRFMAKSVDNPEMCGWIDVGDTLSFVICRDGRTNVPYAVHARRKL